MRRPSDRSVALVVMVSIGTGLSGPVLGRLGFEAAAHVMVIVAASLGLLAFLLAGAGSLAALRRAPERAPDEERRAC